VTAPRLLIRADADRIIGYGHVMRCFALAQACLDRGGACAFHTRDPAPTLYERFVAEGIAVSAATCEPGTRPDAEQTITRASEHLANAIIIDGYQFAADYQSLVRDAHPTLVIDDHAHLDSYVCDILLNQNLGTSASMYAGRANADGRLLLGSDYTLLRREFREWSRPPRSPGDVGRILITLGGSDPEDVTRNMVDAALAATAPSIAIDVVIGPGYQHRASLEAAAPADVRDMTGLMAHADLAITAAGSTTWELARLGVPMLLVTVAENQRAIAAALADAGAAEQLGSHSDLDDPASKIRVAVDQVDQRANLSRRAATLIDGRGADRVLDTIVEGTGCQ